MAPRIYKREAESDVMTEDDPEASETTTLATKIFGKHGKHLHKVIITTTIEPEEGNLFSIFIYDDLIMDMKRKTIPRVTNTNAKKGKMKNSFIKISINFRKLQNFEHQIFPRFFLSWKNGKFCDDPENFM